MNHSHVRTHPTRFLIIAAVLGIAAACTVSGDEKPVPVVPEPAADTSVAGDRASWVGSWAGSGQAGSRTGVALALGVTSTSASLHLGSPFQCQMIASPGATDGSTVNFDVDRSNGGWCDRMLAGRIVLEPDAADSMRVELFDSDGSSQGHGTLARSSNP